MAFKKAYLCSVARITSSDELKPQNALYTYQTADAVSVVGAPNYFDTNGQTLYVGDIILCDCNGILQHRKVTAAPSNGDAHVLTASMGSNNGSITVSGQATTVTASDTIVTGLGVLTSAVASLEDAPVIGCDRAQAAIGTQAGAPAAGSLLLKSFKPTAAGDATPIAATTFGKKVNWMATGALP